MSRALALSLLWALVLTAAPVRGEELQPQGPDLGPAPHLVLGLDGGLVNVVHAALFSIDAKVGGGVRFGSFALTAIFEGDAAGGRGAQDIHEAAYWIFPQIDLARLDAPLRWHLFAGAGYGRFDASALGWSFDARKALYGGGVGLGSGWFDVTVRYIAPAVPVSVNRVDYGTFGLGLQVLLGIRYDDTIAPW